MNTEMQKPKGSETALTNGLILSLTPGGDALGETLIKALPIGWEHLSRETMKQNGGIQNVVAKWFHCKDALVFIGAAGIAVRVIAPYLKDKFSDPAVLVMDEKGQHVISLLSGHVGGANQLAKTLAVVTGGTAVVTTATDVNDRAGMDLILKALGCPLEANRNLCLEASRQIVGGATLGLFIDEAFMPEYQWRERLSKLCLSGLAFYGIEQWQEFIEDSSLGLRVYIGFDKKRIETLKTLKDSGALNDSGVVVPRVFALGTGARKGQDTPTYQRVLSDFLEAQGIVPEAVSCLASVDLKSEEACMLATAECYNWETCFYSAERLKAYDGQFDCSEIVYKTLGLRAVSGPAAMCAARLEKAEDLYGTTVKSEGCTFSLGRIQK